MRQNGMLMTVKQHILLMVLLLNAVVMPQSKAEYDGKKGKDADIERAYKQTFVKTAKSVEGFVPKGWGIIGQQAMDLDGDRKLDIALLLRPTKVDELIAKEPGCGACVGETYKTVILVALLRKREYERIAFNDKMTTGREVQASVSAKSKRVLKLFIDLGGHYTSFQYTFSYRYDVTSNRMQVIGSDFRYMTNTGSGTDTSNASENYLTGKRIVDGNVTQVAFKQHMLDELNFEYCPNRDTHYTHKGCDEI